MDWPSPVRAQAIRGVLWAFGATSVSTVLLTAGIAAGGGKFWRMFGAGVALRFAALLKLMMWAWSAPGQEASAVLGGYVLGLSALMLIEYRHLVKQREL